MDVSWIRSVMFIVLLLAVMVDAGADVNVWSTKNGTTPDTRAVVVDPQTPSRVYVGTYGDAVYVSSTAGPGSPSRSG